MDYGAVGGKLLGNVGDAADSFDDIQDEIKERVPEVPPIDVSSISSDLGEAVEVGAKVKAAAEDAKAKVQEHVNKAKSAIASGRFGAMLMSICSAATKKRFNALHIALAVALTILVFVLISVFSPSDSSQPAENLSTRASLYFINFARQPVSALSIPAGNHHITR